MPTSRRYAPAERPGSEKPGSENPVTVSYTGPVATYKVTPLQPPELRAVLGQETQVRVRVLIDEKVRVTKAEPVVEKGVHQLLVGASVRAAFRLALHAGACGRSARAERNDAGVSIPPAVVYT